MRNFYFGEEDYDDPSQRMIRKKVIKGISRGWNSLGFPCSINYYDTIIFLFLFFLSFFFREKNNINMAWQWSKFNEEKKNNKNEKL